MQYLFFRKSFTALAIISVGLFSACSTTQPAVEEELTSLKVLSYNIWEGFEGGKEEQERFVDWMEAQNADVAALQELVGISEASLKKIAKKWGHPYVVTLKDEGYPLGLTSRYPINKVRRVQEGLHHGYLYAETGGVGFYVVHLSPDDVQKRTEEAEIVVEDIKRSTLPEYYMVLGDFNNYSPQDSFTYVQRFRYFPEADRTEQIQERLESYTKAETYQPMRLFEQAGLQDLLGVAQRYIGAKTTYPSGVFGPMPEYNRHRTDFILSNEALLPHLKSAEVVKDKDTDYLSDHYPLVVTVGGL